jgi:D-alanyl-D-alanine carboxypeptidase (penicillin-binding protein 5/6)
LKKIFRFLLILLLCGTLYAQNNYTPGIDFYPHPALTPNLSTPPEIESRFAVLVDAVTGTVLYAKNPRDEMPPASLTKLMTLHLLQNAIDSGRTSLDAIVPIGKESWAQNQPPRSSLMFLAPGQTVTLREIMLGLAVSSGNDAAVAAALYLAPSVGEFAGMMTQEARRMGLRVTRFVEPSGISEFNLTTASEYAVFCREYVRLHPRSLTDLHSVLEFAYPKAVNVPAAIRGNPGTIVQANRNNLLRTFPGTDGLKTGYIDESGYNIVLTAQRNGTRFIAVILGAPGRPNGEGERIRDRDGEKLLSWAFENFKTVRYRMGPIEPARLWKGRQRRVELIPAEDADFLFLIKSNTVAFTAPVGRGQNIYQVT